MFVRLRMLACLSMATLCMNAAHAAAGLTGFGVSGSPAASPSFSSNGQIWDAGLISGAVQTEYAASVGTSSPLNLQYNQTSSTDGCLWDASLSPFSGCPGRSGMGTVWQGTLQGRSACGGNTTITGDTWAGCTQYSGSTAFSQGSPSTNYWMVHANDDPSFDQCNDGPPGASHPILNATNSSPDIYKIDMSTPSGSVPKLGRIQLNLDQKAWFCLQANAYQFSIPFISVGAQNGRGNPGPVGTISTSGSPTGTIVFSESVPSFITPSCAAGTSSICNTSITGLHLGVYGVASWSGTRRLIFVDLFSTGSVDSSGTGPGEGKWNWPIFDSTFFPGAETVTFTAGSQLSSKCGINIPQISLTGTLQNYKIDFGKLIQCGSTLGMFTQAPPSGAFALDGVHWFIEGIGTAGNTEIDLKNVETAIFISGFE